MNRDRLEIEGVEGMSRAPFSMTVVLRGGIDAIGAGGASWWATPRAGYASIGSLSEDDRARPSGTARALTQGSYDVFRPSASKLPELFHRVAVLPKIPRGNHVYQRTAA
jgi:hypothetical protein